MSTPDLKVRCKTCSRWIGVQWRTEAGERFPFFITYERERGRKVETQHCPECDAWLPGMFTHLYPAGMLPEDYAKARQAGPGCMLFAILAIAWALLRLGA